MSIAQLANGGGFDPPGSRAGSRAGSERNSRLFDTGPKVSIGKEMDMKLRPPGKRCAAAGLPNLPGGMMRCHSMPGRALTCPSGWLAEEVQRSHHQSAQRRETLRCTSANSHSMHTGTWSDLTSSIRPSTVAVERCPGGGRTQGARTMRPMTEGAMAYGDYNPAHHGWHDPRGQMEQTRLADCGPNSWAWTMRKARDHTGFGDDGMVSWGDVQGTAVSGDGPEWFVGTKTVIGPLSTKTVPVRRHPFVHIEGKNMRYRGKTYERGNHLTCHEEMHETNNAPILKRRQNRADDGPPDNIIAECSRAMEAPNKAKYCSLIHGGCQTKPNPYPLSRHVIREGRTQKGI